MSIYYHYTDPDSAKKIKKSGKIKQSSEGGPDATFGPGTYLTKTPPTKSPRTIAKNNYDDRNTLVNQKLDEGKIDRVVAVRIPKGDPNIRKCPSQGRDVHIYQGDLNLKDKKHAILDTEKVRAKTQGK